MPPPKRVKQTDAIFDQLKVVNPEADRAIDTLRISIDAKATAWVLYGTIPMYRDLGPGVANGSDVRQLERNLKALGYDPGTVDDEHRPPREAERAERAVLPRDRLVGVRQQREGEPVLRGELLVALDALRADRQRRR